MNRIGLQDMVSSKIIETADSPRNSGLRFGGDSLETSHCCEVRETLQFRESTPENCSISVNVRGKTRIIRLPFPARQRALALACKCSRSKRKKTCEDRELHGSMRLRGIFLQPSSEPYNYVHVSDAAHCNRDRYCRNCRARLGRGVT